MHNATHDIDRGQALMHFYDQYAQRRQGHQLPDRLHDNKETIIELICAGISAKSAFDMVLTDDFSKNLIK